MSKLPLDPENPWGCPAEGRQNAGHDWPTELEPGHAWHRRVLPCPHCGNEHRDMVRAADEKRRRWWEARMSELRTADIEDCLTQLGQRCDDDSDEALWEAAADRIREIVKGAKR